MSVMPGCDMRKTHRSVCLSCEKDYDRRDDAPEWEGYCSRACSKAREAHPAWKGTDAGYIAKHMRVHRSRGSAAGCVWGCTAARYEWANLTDDYDDIWDYASMCKLCHERYDQARASMEPGAKHHANAKITEEQALLAIKRVAAGETQVAVALDIGIAQSTLSQIIRGAKWKHLQR